MKFRSPHWRRRQPLRKYTRFARSLRMIALPWLLLGKLPVGTKSVRARLETLLARRNK